jgi:alpha-glucosidase
MRCGADDEFDLRVLIGEIYLPPERLVAYYGADLQRICRQLRAVVGAMERARNEKIISSTSRCCPREWPNWVLGIMIVHGKPGGRAQARCRDAVIDLAGTPTLYYGDEIGMHQVAIAPEQVRDPREERAGDRRRPRGAAHTDAWDATVRGFSTSSRAAAGGRCCPRKRGQSNADALDPELKALDRFALKSPQLISGDYMPIAAEGDCCLSAAERGEGTDCAQSGSGTRSIASDAAGLNGEILLSTFLDRQGEKIQGALDLRGDEGVIIGV